MEAFITDLAKKYGIPYEKMEEYVDAIVDHIENKKVLDMKLVEEMGENVKESIMNEITLFKIP